MKRWAVRICGFLLLGAIVNVAVAWGFCMFAYRDAVAQVAFRHPPTSAELAWFGSIQPPQGVNEPFEVWPHVVAGYAETRYLGHGPIHTSASGQTSEITSSSNRSEAGWPLRSLRGVWFGIPDTSTGKWRHEMRGAIRNWQQMPALFPKRSAYLPWHPLWPGFAINTVFYVVILWLLCVAPFALRRRRRIQRGLCPKCAYDLRGSSTTSDVCPECGATFSPRRGDGM